MTLWGKSPDPTTFPGVSEETFRQIFALGHSDGCQKIQRIKQQEAEDYRRIFMQELENYDLLGDLPEPDDPVAFVAAVYRLIFDQFNARHSLQRQVIALEKEINDLNQTLLALQQRLDDLSINPVKNGVK
jgi:hypothetical protein